MGARIYGIVVKTYNYIIRWKILNLNTKICRKIRNMLMHNICVEKRASFGRTNPDKLFYVIRDPKERAGLFSVHNYVVHCLKKCEEINAIPIIDMQHYPNEVIADDRYVGKRNMWEYFFRQTYDYTLEEIYKSKNVIMGSSADPASLGEIYDPKEIFASHFLLEKYVLLNDDMMDKCQQTFIDFHMDEGKTLAVICRGTDYIGTRPEGHSIMPSVDQIIATINEKWEEWGAFSRIYLATEDEAIFQTLKNVYGDRIVSYQQMRFQETGDRVLSQIIKDKKEENFKHKLSEEYFISIWLVSQCNALIAPIVSSTLAALRMKRGGYENTYIFMLGNYQ